MFSNCRDTELYYDNSLSMYTVKYYIYWEKKMKSILMLVLLAIVVLLGTVNSSYGTNITMNSDDHSLWVAPPLLNPVASGPLAEEVPYDTTNVAQFYLTKSIFKLNQRLYSTKELTRFANPNKCLGFLWPEWSRTYKIEIAIYQKYRSSKRIHLLKTEGNRPCIVTCDFIKIGQAHGYAIDLNKSEHQVLSALAVKAAEAGANLVIYRYHSNSVVKINSFVVGGGTIQVANPKSVFSGSTGIGSVTSEKLTRAFVVAELYR